MTPDTKPFWQSKTFWTNALLFAAAKVPALQGVLNADTLPAIFTVVNLLLRLISKDKVTLA